MVERDSSQQNARVHVDLNPSTEEADWLDLTGGDLDPPDEVSHCGIGRKLPGWKPVSA